MHTAQDLPNGGPQSVSNDQSVHDEGGLKETSTPVYDVVIVGGGAAGVGSAIGAKQTRPNARVLLIESEGSLGGAAAHRGVLSYCGLYSVEAKPRRAVGQVWTDLHRRLVAERAASPRPDKIVALVQNVEPEGLKRALDDFLHDHGVQVLLHCTVVGAERLNNRVRAIEIQERRGRRKIFARAFVDCSGDGDLSFHAQASTRYGNHGNVNLGSLSTRFGGLQNANPTSNLWRDAIMAAKELDPSLKHIIPRNVGVLIKLPESGDIVSYMASAAYDARDSSSITAAEMQGRRQAGVYLEILRQLPGHEKMYLVSTGPNFGTRESRHVNSKYQLSKTDLETGRHFDDTVAIGAWYMEWHDGSKEDWPILFTAPKDGVFDIPLRSLQSIDTENLFCAGRCADGDQAASSAIRVMGTALATGQAAGVAAVLTAEKGFCPSASEIRDFLRKQGAFIDKNKLPDAPSSEEDGEMNLSHHEALRGH